MPVYQYRCAECEAEWEEYHSMHETPRIPCPKCSGAQTGKCFNYSVTFIGAKDANWEGENGGKGRRFSQLAKHAKDDSQDCHFRSRNEAIEAAKRRGYTVHSE